MKLPAVIFGGTGYESANQDMPDSLPERFEMGTLNIVGIAGLNASLKWIQEKTIKSISQKEETNRKKLIDLLRNYDFIRIVGYPSNEKYVGIVSCLFDGISSDSVGNVMNEQGIAVRTGLQCAPAAHQFLNTFPSGTVRFSVGYYTNDSDFEELREALDYISQNI